MPFPSSVELTKRVVEEISYNYTKEEFHESYGGGDAQWKEFVLGVMNHEFDDEVYDIREVDGPDSWTDELLDIIDTIDFPSDDEIVEALTLEEYMEIYGDKYN